MYKKSIMKRLLIVTITAVTLCLSCQHLEFVPGENSEDTEETRKPLEITPNSLQIAYNEGFYGIYTSEEQWGECTVLSPNTVRIDQVNYIRKLTNEEKNQIGDSISFRIELYAAYDEWDRNANSWYFKVPKGTTITSKEDLEGIGKFPLIIYTTPYFHHENEFNHITYERNISAYAQDLRDPESDIYIQYEVESNPQKFFSDTIPYCDQPGFRADIFIDTKDKGTIPNTVTNVYVPLISRNLEEGEEVFSTSFKLGEDIEDAYIWYTSSGHGSKEEARTRQHLVSIDDKEVANFDSKIACTPYEYYDEINPWGRKCPGCTWRYPTRNWCQGGEIEPRILKLGSLAKGTHTFTLDTKQMNDEGVNKGINTVTPIAGYLSTNAVIIGRKKSTK
ncbi:hypothetical protein ED312_21810 [Sinomicrobium pectinilyticum]|uniref:Peptide-N-glycosidase F C-terminal domain-containing protein n=2 Tax=Sinomicrobium pectinilyticum TaxID=1084421 RepID=A0A3N0DJ17_SINP1|nr:hypothetical protein ED312_21810 [Sinomicrobium pectinilyticum]